MIDFTTIQEESDFLDFTPPASGGGDNVDYGYEKNADIVENSNLISFTYGNGGGAICSKTDLSSIIGSNSWEFHTKVVNFGSGSKIFFGLSNSLTTTVSALITTNTTHAQFQASDSASYKFATVRVRVSTQKSNSTKHSLTSPINKYLKYEYTGTKYILSHSSDKETWTAINTFDFSTVSDVKKYLFVFIYGDEDDAGVSSLDGKETYFITNNQKLWQAMK